MSHGMPASRNEIETELRDVMAAVLGVDADSINGASSSMTMASWSSLAHMNLILALEDRFGIVFEEQLIPEVMSFRRLCDALAAVSPTPRGQ